MTKSHELPAELFSTLRSQMADRGDAWPEESLQTLAQAGVLTIGIPQELGGSNGQNDLTAVYIDLADADLTTCFVLTQHNSAVSRLLAARESAASRKWLPELASGKSFATVGISHLTTSRQHVAEPPVRITKTADGFQLDGRVPWATSAAFADVVVVGGTCEDGTEMLFAADTDQPGWKPGPAGKLLALSGSSTGEIVLESVCVSAESVLVGPINGVMKTGAGGAGSLTTSALAVGLSQRAIRHFGEEADKRTDLKATYDPLQEELSDLRAALLSDDGTSVDSSDIRTRANSLALRSSQALMTACKGAGFLVGHPAELAIREAMFFLVWSCPKPVADAAMQDFACRPFCDV